MSVLLGIFLSKREGFSDEPPSSGAEEGRDENMIQLLEVFRAINLENVGKEKEESELIPDKIIDHPKVKQKRKSKAKRL